MEVTITGSRHPAFPDRPGPFEGRVYDVPPGAVLVEYVGDQSPFDDPFVTLKIQMGKYSADAVAIMREMARRAIKPWPHLRRTLTKGGGKGEFPGFSRSYVFGHGQRHKPPVEPGQPGSFFQLMTNRDADLLKSSEAGYQFRIYPHEESILVIPSTDIRIVQRDDFRNYGRGWTRLPG
jgi:hypothetical protein